MRKQLLKKQFLLVLLTMLIAIPQGVWAENYGLTVAGVQVTDANASGITGDNITGTVSYTHSAADNSGILTLSGATLTGNIEVNGISALTIKVAGQNVINAGSVSALKSNVGTNAVTLAFAKEGSGNCSLTLNSTEVTVISTGFSTPTYTDLALVVDGVEDPDYYSLYGLAYYAGNDVYSPITSATITSYETYGIIVSGETVTNLNKDNICKGTVGSGHILFDGEHTLTFNNVPDMVFNGEYPFIQTSMDLTINLVGTSYFDCGNSVFITRMGDDMQTYTVTFTTDEDNPGMLTLQVGDQFDGFDKAFENGLSWNPDGYYSSSDLNGPVAWVAQPVASYNLTVGGTAVTSANAPNVLGESAEGQPTVVFDASTSTLTLNDAMIEGGIVSGLDNLTIHLVGYNNIYVDNGHAISSSVSTATLTFTSAKENNEPTGHLSLSNMDNPISGFGSVNYEDGLAIGYFDGIVIQKFDYISINNGETETKITSNNLSVNCGDGTASFNPANNTLTLTNATITGCMTWLSYVDDLTIKIVGNNTISGDENGCLYNSDGTALIFEKGGDACSLALSCTGDDHSVIQGFSGVSYNNMYLQTYDPNIYDTNENVLVTQTSGDKINSATITSEVSYPIWMGINHTQLTETNNQGSVVFDGTNKLTLNGYSESDVTYAFYIGQEIKNLEAHLVGTNRVYGSGFYFADNSPSLTFTTADTPGSFEVSGNIAVCNNAGIINIACENGLVLNDKKVSADGVRVKIGETEITGTTTTVEGYEGVSFDASTNTLTLSGASIPYEQDKEVMVYVDNLKVNISGENAIDVNIRYSGQNHNTSSIQINKASNEGTPRLTVPNIQGFASCTCGEGLYLSGYNLENNVIEVHYNGGLMESYYGELGYVAFSTSETNTIWVAGVMSTGGNIEGTGISGTVEYNATDRILTLNDAIISTSDNNPSPLIVCSGDLTVELVGSDNKVYFNGDYSTYVIKNNGTTGTLTFTGEGTLSITSECYEGDYKGLCDGFGTVNFNDNLGYQIWAGTKKISPVNIPTPMMYVSEGELNFQTDGYLFGSTTYYKIVYADGSGDEEEVPLTNSMTGSSVNWSSYNESITISQLTGPCTVYAYTKYNTETGNSAKAKLFGPASTKQTIVYGADPVELALAPAIEEGDGIMIYGIESSYISFDEETQKATATTMGSGSFPVPLKYTAGQYTTGNTIILNSENFEMQVEVVRDLGIEFVDDNSWASYYATETLAVPEGLTAYVVSSVNEENGAVTVASIDYIPANNGVLLQRAANGAASGYTAGEYTGNTTQVTNLLAGSQETTEISSIQNQPVYVLFNDKFKRATSGTIPARRAYLALSAAVAPAHAPQFMNINIGDGSVTAIKTLSVDDNSNDSWYTIDGLKLNGKPQRKGLYINNGKKKYINNNK